MRTIIISFFCYLALAFSLPLQQSWAAGATTLQDLTITEEEPLNFGRFTSSGAGGSVTLNPETGAVTTSGGATALANYDAQRAEYTISGTPNEVVNIILPDVETNNLDLTANPSNGNGSATVTVFTSFPDESLTLDNNGKATLYVGGTVDITKGTTLIDFLHDFDVTVEYANNTGGE